MYFTFSVYKLWLVGKKEKKIGISHFSLVFHLTFTFIAMHCYGDDAIEEIAMTRASGFLVKGVHVTSVVGQDRVIDRLLDRVWSMDYGIPVTHKFLLHTPRPIHTHTKQTTSAATPWILPSQWLIYGNIDFSMPFGESP